MKEAATITQSNFKVRRAGILLNLFSELYLKKKKRTRIYALGQSIKHNTPSKNRPIMSAKRRAGIEEDELF